MSVELVAFGLWAVGAISLLLSAMSLASPSWMMLWLAALLSLLFSLAAGFSIGGFVFLITCLQLGSAVALRWGVGGRGWALLLTAAVLVWTVVVPGQQLIQVWVPWVFSFPLVAAVASLCLVVGDRRGA